jgi:hypothetical protein
MATTQSALGLFGVNTQSDVNTSASNVYTISGKPTELSSSKWFIFGGIVAIGLVFVLYKKLK